MLDAIFIMFATLELDYVLCHSSMERNIIYVFVRHDFFFAFIEFSKCYTSTIFIGPSRGELRC